MFVLKKNQIYASEIAEFLNNRLYGEDFLVKGPCSLNWQKSESFTFATSSEYLKKISINIRPLLIICPIDLKDEKISFSAIYSKNPRLDFVKTVQEFFTEEMSHKIHPKSIIESGAKIGENVAIGAHSIIDPEVEIMENTFIGRNVVISGQIKIGKNCVIKDNATIGSEGFSFVYNETDIPIHLSQIGQIIIGNHVWIGSNSTIERPGLDATIIEDHVKIDDLVQIGHDCIIGEKTQITAGVILCSGVKVGKKCWLSPNVTIKDGVSIGDGALVGMGGVVIKDVLPHTVVAGNPARLLEKKS